MAELTYGSNGFRHVLLVSIW